MSNVLSDLIANFQDLVAQVPDAVQPLIVAAAGAVPFIEGEGSAVIGIIGGINPVIAAIAGIVGNFLCVAVLVLLGSRVRTAVTARRESTAEVSPRREKFQRAFTRYGVPGVSLLGPLLLPTQFTAVMLVGSGVSRGRVLLWQGIAIVGWTTVMTLIVTGVIRFAGA
ncbi:MAG: small multidrug efflux protein [Mycetocola sp.]